MLGAKEISFSRLSTLGGDSRDKKFGLKSWRRPVRTRCPDRIVEDRRRHPGRALHQPRAGQTTACFRKRFMTASAGGRGSSSLGHGPAKNKLQR